MSLFIRKKHQISGALLTQLRDDKDGIRTINEHRKVLSRCRREGTDAAFADRTEADLMYIAEALHQLVEETPTLAALLLPWEMDVEAAQNQRKMNAACHEARLSQSQYPQQHAAQIHNHIVECLQELE